jgi:hypothetical protein
MRVATWEWITLGVQVLCLATLGWITVNQGAGAVMLAVPHSVYGLPPCPTEDHGLPGGCTWQGEEDTFVIYTPGRK